jgi:hypothetical protein
LINWNGIKNNIIEVGQALAVSGNLAPRSYEKWNTPNSLTSKTVSAQKILAPDTAKVEESGFAILTEEVTHPSIAPGTMILAINPDTQKQCLILVKKQAAVTDNAVIGLDQNTLKQLGSKGNQSRIIIKYNQ